MSSDFDEQDAIAEIVAENEMENENNNNNENNNENVINHQNLINSDNNLLQPNQPQQVAVSLAVAAAATAQAAMQAAAQLNQHHQQQQPFEQPNIADQQPQQNQTNNENEPIITIDDGDSDIDEMLMEQAELEEQYFAAQINEIERMEKENQDNNNNEQKQQILQSEYVTTSPLAATVVSKPYKPFLHSLFCAVSPALLSTISANPSLATCIADA